ncbi:MAG TPA: OmpA family protein, partial [Solimonas sp.]|nr:OmpA family protein [Solimonas sp.]
EVAKMLKSAPDLKLEVGGHTDNVGQPAANQKLSEARAQAVQAALVAQGIAAARLSAKGYGDTRPVADNRSEDGRAKNRRVELTKK